MVDYHPRDAQSADENVGQGLVPCRIDSVTHKGLPYGGVISGVALN